MDTVLGNYPAFKVPSVERRAAVAGYLHILRDAFLQSGRRHDDFEHRSRRQLRLNGLVQQRMIIVVDQFRPFTFLDAHGKIVGIVGRSADHRENLARARIEGYDRAVPAFQRLLSGDLQININRQL